MRGRAVSFQWVQQPPTKDDLLAVRTVFERALEIDPKNADAFVGSAHTYMVEYVYGWTDPGTDYDAKILDQADRGIALARDNAWAYGVKSIYLNISRRPNDALRVANAGLALDPSNALLISLAQFGRNLLGSIRAGKIGCSASHAPESA